MWLHKLYLDWDAVRSVRTAMYTCMYYIQHRIMNVENEMNKKKPSSANIRMLLLFFRSYSCYIHFVCLFIFHNFSYNFLFSHLLLSFFGVVLLTFQSMQYTSIYARWVNFFKNFLCVSFHSISDTGRKMRSSNWVGFFWLTNIVGALLLLLIDNQLVSQ